MVCSIGSIIAILSQKKQNPSPKPRGFSFWRMSSERQASGQPMGWSRQSIDPTYSLHCSSFLGLPFWILNIELVKPPKKGTTMETLGKPKLLGLGFGLRVPVPGSPFAAPPPSVSPHRAPRNPNIGSGLFRG